MLVRKYNGRDFEDALSQVKRELGDSATVLSSRRIRQGLLSSTVELTAAIGASAVPDKAPAKKKPAKRESTRQPGPRRRSEMPAGQAVARAVAPLRNEMRALRQDLMSLVSETRQRPGSDDFHALQALICAALPAEDKLPAELAEARKRLEQGGMNGELAQELVEAVAHRLPDHEEDPATFIDALLTAHLRESIRCARPVECAGGPRVVALVGPPGAGKTTTLAKIAVRAALVEGRKVGVIGCDGEQLGAVPGLQALADAIDVPIELATTRGELDGALGRLDDCDLILLDTSGYAPRDASALSTLRAELAEANARVLLVLPADLRRQEMEAAVAGFGALKPRAVVFTRLDLAVANGGLYDAMVESELPVMYLSDGRRIPDNLDTATPDQLAELIVGLQLN